MRGSAITGERFTVRHPDSEFDAPFTSHVDVAFDGITHQVLTTADRSGFSFANTTGEFAIGELRGHIVETIDTVATQAVHRYQAIVGSAHGVLATQSYDSAESALALVAALGPLPTRLGMTIEPNTTVEVVGSPKVALNTHVGVLEITPLSADVDRQLPRWRGTAVAHGDLYAGRLSDRAAYLILVTATCRGVLMLAAGTDPDAATRFLADLDLVWEP